MRILCLTDFPVPKYTQWLWDYAHPHADDVIFLHTKTVDRFAYWGKLLTSYPRLLSLGFQAIQKVKRESFDVVVAWEGKTGFPLALLRRLINISTPPLVVLAFSLRGPVTSLPLLGRFGSKGMQYATVPSQHEKDYFTRLLNFPTESMKVCPIGMYDILKDQNYPQEDFIFTGGRSGRDYATFLQAVAKTTIPVVLNARPHNLKNLPIPANVRVNDLLPSKEFFSLTGRSRFVVVPLYDVHESVGLTSVLLGMAAGKATIVSRASGIEEYIQHGETGLLVQPGDAGDMRQAILYLWDHPEDARRMGQRAREVFLESYTFEKFAQRTVQAIHDLVGKP